MPPTRITIAATVPAIVSQLGGPADVGDGWAGAVGVAVAEAVSPAPHAPQNFMLELTGLRQFGQMGWSLMPRPLSGVDEVAIQYVSYYW